MPTPPGPTLSVSALQSLLTPPKELLSRVRWLFLVFTLVSAALVLMMLGVSTPTSTPLLRAGAGAAVLWVCGGWIRGYRLGAFPQHWYAVEALTFALLGLALGDPQRMQVLMYIALYYRSTYGSTREVLGGLAAFLGGFLGATAVTGGITSSRLLSPEMLVHAPGMTVAALLMHLVGGTMERHERSAVREKVLARVGVSLVAAPDRDAVCAAALDAARSLLYGAHGWYCAIAIGSPEGMTVAGAAGDRAERAAGRTLDSSLLPKVTRDALAQGRLVQARDAEIGRLLMALDIEAGSGAVILVPLLAQRHLHGIILAGATGIEVDEVREGLEALGSAVALALERAGLTQNLQHNEGRFRSLVQESSDVITVVGGDWTITFESPSAERVFGYTPAAMIGTNLVDVVHPDDGPRALTLLAEATRQPGGHVTLEYRLLHRDGSWRYVETIATNLLADPNVGGMVLNTRDVTERKTLEDQLTHQAFHDGLTNLANRTLFRDRVEHALARGSRHNQIVVVLFMDLDGFKAINDSLGHTAGDRLLIAVADRLRLSIRTTDTAARLGGDEFAILAEELDGPADAPGVAERVINALGPPFTLQEAEVFIQASVGIAISTPGQGNADELLRNADVAMYMAKSRGKGRYEIFEEPMYAAVLDRLQIEGDLRRAVERQEFTIHYQPIVELKTGRIAGVEALVRWAHPQRGMLMPKDFVQLAEGNGLIVPLGRWVLQEVCREGRVLQADYPGTPPLTVSVNVSAKQLQQPEFATEVAQVLQETGLDPHTLILEITESALMEDTEVTVIVLEELRRLGVRLAIDDFGTGYSSLNYIRRYPIDLIKIEKSFLSEVGKGTEASAMARAIITISGILRMQTVTEGIELAEQLEEIRTLGSELGQGFYFSEPLTRDGLVALFQKRRETGPPVVPAPTPSRAG